MKKLLVGLKHWLALVYGMVLLVMVVAFFFSYGGDWMRQLAEKLPIHVTHD